MKKSWKLSDLKEYQTAPPYAKVENKRSPTIFRRRRKRRCGFAVDALDPDERGEEVLSPVGREVALEDDESGVLGAIGGWDVV